MVSKLLLVLIPVYKKVDELIDLEIVSIRNTILKFKESHTIGLLISNESIFRSYKEFFNFHFIEFQFTFSSWAEYNALLKMGLFYEKISEYHYLLVVQTDAFVFSNNLSDFYKYDYVGAPWHRDPLRFIKGRVGNGGFSLRNIKNTYAILNSDKRLFNLISLLHLNYKHFYKYGPLKRVNGFKRFTIFQIVDLFLKSFYQYLFLNTFKKAHLFESLMEDTLFGVLFPNRFSSFKVPDINIATKFSIDDSPEYFFNMNDNVLPIGCHAFIRNYAKFWIKFI